MRAKYDMGKEGSYTFLLRDDGTLEICDNTVNGELPIELPPAAVKKLAIMLRIGVPLEEDE